MNSTSIVEPFGRFFYAGAINCLLLLAAGSAVGIIPALAQSPAAKPAEPTSPDTASAKRCQEGYVWREATPGDHVCVTPETRDLTAAENATAAERRRPDSGDACLEGLVRRLATPNDHVCVTLSRAKRTI
jgi:hypothetical protein